MGRPAVRANMAAAEARRDKAARGKKADAPKAPKGSKAHHISMMRRFEESAAGQRSRAARHLSRADDRRLGGRNPGPPTVYRLEALGGAGRAILGDILRLQQGVAARQDRMDLLPQAITKEELDQASASGVLPLMLVIRCVADMVTLTRNQNMPFATPAWAAAIIDAAVILQRRWRRRCRRYSGRATLADQLFNPRSWTNDFVSVTQRVIRMSRADEMSVGTQFPPVDNKSDNNNRRSAARRGSAHSRDTFEEFLARFRPLDPQETAKVGTDHHPFLRYSHPLPPPKRIPVVDPTVRRNSAYVNFVTRLRKAKSEALCESKEVDLEPELNLMQTLPPLQSQRPKASTGAPKRAAAESPGRQRRKASTASHQRQRPSVQSPAPLKTVRSSPAASAPAAVRPKAISAGPLARLGPEHTTVPRGLQPPPQRGLSAASGRTLPRVPAVPEARQQRAASGASRVDHLESIMRARFGHRPGQEGRSGPPKMMASAAYRIISRLGAAADS